MDMVKAFISGFKAGTSRFGALVTDSVNLVLLVVIYFFVVGLTAVAARLARKKFLHTHLNQSQASYWVDIDQKELDEEDYFYRQF